LAEVHEALREDVAVMAPTYGVQADEGHAVRRQA
jgi:hypothetical protein